MIREDLSYFLRFLKDYFFSRALYFGENFEKVKDLIVAFLLIKRGRYTTSFFNLSFFFLVAAAFIAGPIIAENNPFVSSSPADLATTESILTYNPLEYSPQTIISKKPEIVDYQVKSGDTLASIARRFNISIDSIKGSNGLKNDIIKPGQVLKIPPDEGIVHKIEVGESIYSIAKKYNVSPQNIVNFPMNEFVDYDTFALRIGQFIFVPGGKIVEKPVTPSRGFVAQIQAGVRGSSNFIWPTSGSITQYPVWYHLALDIANSSSPSILAADSGTVVYAGCVGWGYGCHIVIDHGNGYQTLYAHLSRYHVKRGQAVSQGEVIGIMGSTGRSSGTHLHFEIRSGGQLLNPLNFLK